MSDAPTKYEALQQAIEIAGSQAALARVCGVGQPAVSKWVQSSKRVPAEYVLRIEAELGISRHHLRPDIYPIELPEVSTSRWYGVDQCADVHDGGVDARAARVSFNRCERSQGAAA